MAALTAKVKGLEVQYRVLQSEHSRCQPRIDRTARLPPRVGADQVLEVLYDRATLGSIVHAMPREQRMNLLGVIAEG